MRRMRQWGARERTCYPVCNPLIRGYPDGHQHTCRRRDWDLRFRAPLANSTRPRGRTVFPASRGRVSYLLGGGWWLLWYGTLWVSLVPYVAMTAALVRATPNEPMPAMETAFALSTM